MYSINNIFLNDDNTDDRMLCSEIVREIYAHYRPKLPITTDGVKQMEVLENIVPPATEVIFLQEINRTPKLQGIPIIIFSSNTDSDDRPRGANYSICKPHSCLLLKETIQQSLSFGDKLQERPRRDTFVTSVT